MRRRPLILLLTFLTGSLTIGLAVTSSLVAFEVLCFLVGVFTVVPQILMPLAADLAPPERRASALSIVLSGELEHRPRLAALAGECRGHDARPCREHPIPSFQKQRPKRCR